MYSGYRRVGRLTGRQDAPALKLDPSTDAEVANILRLLLIWTFPSNVGRKLFGLLGQDRYMAMVARRVLLRMTNLLCMSDAFVCLLSQPEYFGPQIDDLGEGALLSMVLVPYLCSVDRGL